MFSQVLHVNTRWNIPVPNRRAFCSGIRAVAVAVGTHTVFKYHCAFSMVQLEWCTFFAGKAAQLLDAPKYKCIFKSRLIENWTVTGSISPSETLD